MEISKYSNQGFLGLGHSREIFCLGIATDPEKKPTSQTSQTFHLCFRGDLQ